VPAVDCGGRVLAPLGGHALGLGERVDQPGAELCILVLEGGDAHGPSAVILPVQEPP
jgi:hypothetical protein